MVVDLSALRRCDCRLLPVLERVHQRLQPIHGQLRAQGLDPDSLTGFGDAGLVTVLDAYRASLAQQPHHDGTRTTGRCSPAERHLALACIQLSGPLGEDFTEETLAARLVDHCMQRLAIDSATVLLVDHDTSLRVAAASDLAARTLEWSAISGRQGPGADCCRTGERVRSLNLAHKTRWPEFTPAATQHRIASVFALPLRHHDTTIGALDLFTAHPGPMAATDLDVAGALAQLVAITILASRRTRAPEPTPTAPTPTRS